LTDAAVAHAIAPGSSVNDAIIRDRKPLIELVDATRKHGAEFQLKIPHLAIAPGQITAVVGPNGSGKTTLLRILAGELALDSGALNHRFRDSSDPYGASMGGWLAERDPVAYRAAVAFVPQSPYPWPMRLRAALEREAAAFGFKGKQAVERASWWLTRLGLNEYSERPHRKLSDGYRMRAAIAMCMVRQPQVLILDEPFGPLDVKAQEVVLSDLRDIADSERWPLPIVVSSQHLHEIESIADILIFVAGGEVRFCGTKDDLRAQFGGNVFEVQCTLPDDEFVAALEGLGHVDVRHHSLSNFVRCPQDIGSDSVLRAILDAGGQLTVFRDLTGSSRVLFEEAM
jgi:ABC-2 type transport system ATP-binding protein